jgi:hypothetical protein
MYFVDHPPPHVHARYSGDEALIVIENRRGVRRFAPRSSSPTGARMA